MTWSARQDCRSPRGGPIRVELRGGTYFLNECLTLSPADSGTEKAPVIWAAYQDEHPVLSGGVRLTGWTRTKVNGHDAWVAKLPGGEKAPRIPRALDRRHAADPRSLAEAGHARPSPA